MATFCENVFKFGTKSLEIILGVICFGILIGYGCLPYSHEKYIAKNKITGFTPAIFGIAFAGTTFFTSFMLFITICIQTPRKEFVMLFCCVLFSILSGALFLNTYVHIKNDSDVVSAGIGVGVLQLLNAIVYAVDATFTFRSR